jgi:guanine deaminase
MNQEFLREAIRLSIEKSQAGEGGPFGAVIVRNHEIVGRGWNRVTSTNDPTAHASGSWKGILIVVQGEE